MTDPKSWPLGPLGLVFGAVYEAGGVLLRLRTLTLWDGGWEAEWISLDPAGMWRVKAWDRGELPGAFVDVQRATDAPVCPTLGSVADEWSDVPRVIAEGIGVLAGHKDGT